MPAEDDPRRWPPGPRYAVADLELSGVPRAEAVAQVRAGELAGEELPADRRDWPEAALREFWSLVKWLNATARETGRAVEGKAQRALEDADRAVRETWLNPRPLGGVAS